MSVAAARPEKTTTIRAPETIVECIARSELHSEILDRLADKIRLHLGFDDCFPTAMKTVPAVPSLISHHDRLCMLVSTVRASSRLRPIPISAARSLGEEITGLAEPR